MSFEYELRLPSGIIVSCEVKQSLRQHLDEIGALPGKKSASRVLYGETRGEDITFYVQEKGLLFSIEDLNLLDAPVLKSLFGLARSLGLKVYEVDDDLPMDILI